MGRANAEIANVLNEDNVAWFNYINRHYPNTEYEDLPWDVIRRQFINDSDDGASVVTDG